MAMREPLPDLQAELAAAAGAAPLAGLRVAYSATLDWFAVDDEVRALTEAAARSIAGLGAEVDEAAPQVEHPMELYFPIFGVDTRRSALPVLDPDDFFPESIEETSRYPALTAEELIGLLARLWRFRSGLADFFAHYDVLITPATATPAFPLGQPPSRIGGVDVEPGWMTFMPFSSPWNLGTHPTASMPAGVTRDGPARRRDGGGRAGAGGSRRPCRRSLRARAAVAGPRTGGTHDATASPPPSRSPPTCAPAAAPPPT